MFKILIKYKIGVRIPLKSTVLILKVVLKQRKITRSAKFTQKDLYRIGLWSSGFGKRLMSERLGVRILALDNLSRLT